MDSRLESRDKLNVITTAKNDFECNNGALISQMCRDSVQFLHFDVPREEIVVATEKPKNKMTRDNVRVKVNVKPFAIRVTTNYNVPMKVCMAVLL